tara:strand:+ start:37 stop:1374 length:1338 start_codon:yes stop_codon:yes gene_type:complete
MYDAIVLGRGPLGVYTSTTLINKNIRILNIDSGNNLKDLKNNKIVNTNINWKSKDEAPSLDKNASDVMWNGGCMSIPVDELGKGKLKLPLDKVNYLNSINRVKEYLEINDFDFLENRPYIYKNWEKLKGIKNDLRYTYILNDWSFEDKIKKLEEDKNYTFIDKLKVFRITPGETIQIECLQDDDRSITYSCKKLYICLGALENTRLLLNNEKELNLKGKDLGLNLSDHLRIPVGKVELTDLKKFKNIFDKHQNRLENNFLLPRLVVGGNEIQSHGYFNFWRYNNLILRKLRLTFLKDRLKFSGTCTLFLFIEKPVNQKTNINISKENLIPEMLVDVTLEESEINKIKEIAKTYFDHLSNNYGDLIKKIEPFEIKNTDKFLETVYSANHPSGTTPLGNSSQNSIVNVESQIWGFENIYVFGSSVLPRAYYIHPTFPSMVIADMSLN